MKRFDKGYIYSGLLSDLFSSFVVVFVFLKDWFLDEEASIEDVIAALPYLAIAMIVIYLCFVVYRILYYKNSGYHKVSAKRRGILLGYSFPRRLKNCRILSLCQNPRRYIFRTHVDERL